MILRRTSRWLLAAGGIGHLALIGWWALSRTTGFGLLGGSVEPFWFQDGITVLLEVGTAGAVAMFASCRRRPGP